MSDPGRPGATGRPVPAGPRLVFDVTTLVRRTAGQPTGIERLLVEIASCLLEDAADVAYCAFDQSLGRFVQLGRHEVLALCRRMRGEAPAASAAARSDKLAYGRDRQAG